MNDLATTTTAAVPFRPGDAVVLTTLEGGTRTKRGVEFVSLVEGGDRATVRWNRESLTVPIEQLSHPAPVQDHPWFLDAPFKVPKPPQPPTPDLLDQRLIAARTALANAHQHVKDVQARVEEARAVAQRASKELATAQATLRVYDQHQKANQAALEDSLRLGKAPPPLSNGDNSRDYLTERARGLETAKARFDRELADCNTALGQALAGSRKASADIIGLLVQRETELLRALESQAAIARAELLAVCSWWPDATLGAIKLPQVTASYLELQPAFSDVTAVRLAGNEGRIRPWKQIFDKLVQGDVQADFTLAGD